MKTIMTTCGAVALLIPLGWAQPETSDAGKPPFFRMPGRHYESRNRSRARNRPCRFRAGRSNCDRADTCTPGDSVFGESRPGSISGDRQPTAERPTQILNPNTRGLRVNSRSDSADRERRTRPHNDGKTRLIEWLTNVDQAFRESRSSGKPVVMKFGADWCNACRRMDRETFSKLEIAKMIQSCFVPLKIDIDEQSRLAENLRITAVPTIIIFSPEGKELQRVEGFHSEEWMQATLRQFCSNPEKKQNRSRSRSHPRD